MSFEIYINRGIEFARKADYNNALNNLNKAIELNSRSPEAFYNRSRVYLKLEKLKESMRDISSAIEINPSLADLYGHRGTLFCHTAEFDKALADMELALKLENANDFRWACRAWVKDKMGDLKGALADYEKALELDPDNPITLNNIGLVEQKLNYSKENTSRRFDKADSLAKELFDKPLQDQPASEVQRIFEEKLELKEKSKDAAKAKMSTRHVTQTLKGIFTDKKERGEFISFIKKSFYK